MRAEPDDKTKLIAILGTNTICYHVMVHSPFPLSAIEPGLLILAYRSGIFPMSDARDDPDVFWIEPRIRAILPLDNFHLSKSLARSLRRETFEVTCNEAFSQVIEECARPRSTDEGQSWISHRIQESYENLHSLGHAHSIECWQIDAKGRRTLAGGLYGVGFDRVFCGESMFAKASNASKVALAWLVAAMQRAGSELLDCQFLTPHLASLGAVELSQKRYLAMLKHAQRSDSESCPALSVSQGYGALLEDAERAGFAASPGKFIAQSLTQTS